MPWPRFLVGLAEHSPTIASGTGWAYLMSMTPVRATFGYAKQGPGSGYTGVKGLNC